MLHRSRPLLALLSPLVLFACNAPTGSALTGSGGSGAHASGSLPCDVDEVLAGHCQQCHGATPQFGAPMPLVTYADLVAPAKTDPSKKVFELVEARTHDTKAPMPQPPNPALGAADQKTIDDWVAAGAPAGNGGCGGGSTT